MQFCLPRNAFKAPLVHLRKVAEKKNGPPALRHILVNVEASADGSGIASFSCTNLETNLTYTAEVTQAVSGAACLPLDGLADALKGRGTKDPILVRAGKSSAEIRTPSTSRSVPLLPMGSFPKLPPMPPLAPVPSVFFSNLLRASVFRSTDSSRLTLNGVHLDHSGKTSCLVATDGHRLITLPAGKLPGSLKTPVTIPAQLFPAKVLAPCSRMLASCGKGRFGFQAGPWQGSTKLIDGDFPAWRQVLPKANAKARIAFADRHLDETLKKLASLKLRKETDQPVGICSNGRTAAVRYHQEETDKVATQAVPGSDVAGQPQHAVVNRRFLLDAMRSGFTELRIAGHDQPLDFRSKVAGERVVIMPLRHDVLSPVTPAQHRTPPRVPQPRKHATMKTKANGSASPNSNLLQEIQSACAAAKTLFREGAAKMNEISTLTKQLARKQKHSASEVRAARQALAKLKSLSF